MIVIAALSGVQEYLFSVVGSGGGQARALRGRSAIVQITMDAVVAQILCLFSLKASSIIYCSAGKAAIDVPAPPANAESLLDDLRSQLQLAVAQESAGLLRLAAGWSGIDDSRSERWDLAEAALRMSKLRPLVPRSNASWSSDSLIIRAVPNDGDEQERLSGLGGRLVDSRIVTLHRGQSRAFTAAGLGFELHTSEEAIAPDSVAAIAVDSKIGVPRWPSGRTPNASVSPSWARPFARSVPKGPDGAVLSFSDLAREAKGATMLGVLKIDADRLGSKFSAAFAGGGQRAVQRLSRLLDDFFTSVIDSTRLGSSSQARSMYTVFAGGDDFLAVGPWDAAIECALDIHRYFESAMTDFAPMTLSGGLAIVKPAYPLHLAAMQADEELERAKLTPTSESPEGRNQFSLLGTAISWSQARSLLDEARQVAGWIDSGTVGRTNINTLLQLIKLVQLDRPGAAIVPSRIAYHVARNWPRPDDRSPSAAAAGRWSSSLVDRVESRRLDSLALVLRLTMLMSRKGAEQGDE